MHWDFYKKILFDENEVIALVNTSGPWGSSTIILRAKIIQNRFVEYYFEIFEEATKLGMCFSEKQEDFFEENKQKKPLHLSTEKQRGKLIQVSRERVSVILREIDRVKLPYSQGAIGLDGSSWTLILRRKDEMRSFYWWGGNCPEDWQDMMQLRDLIKNVYNDIMKKLPLKLKALLEYVQSEGRVVPVNWTKVWEMLPEREHLSSGGWNPPLPLILGAWETTSAQDKRERLALHLRYAAEHGVLDKVDKYLRRLGPERWTYGDGTGTINWERWQELRKNKM